MSGFRMMQRVPRNSNSPQHYNNKKYTNWLFGLTFGIGACCYGFMTFDSCWMTDEQRLDALDRVYPITRDLHDEIHQRGHECNIRNCPYL